MRFVWDAKKARLNIAKHRVAFEDAQRVWDDPYHMLVPDHRDGDEERWHAIGLVEGSRLLVVVHTYPDRDETVVRIISARKAEKHERHNYEEGS